MARYSHRNVGEAREFTRAIVRDQRARIGKGARDPRTWSDTYAIRIANRWHRDISEGRPLDLQSARRGPAFTERARAEQARRIAALKPGQRLRGGAGLEHPRGTWVGPVDAKGRPDESESVGHYARQYRSKAAAGRFVSRLGTERVQVIGSGLLDEGYSPPPPYDVWRVLFTGDVQVATELWDDIAAGYHEPDHTPVFAVLRVIEIRWGPGIGD